MRTRNKSIYKMISIFIIVKKNYVTGLTYVK